MSNANGNEGRTYGPVTVDGQSQLVFGDVNGNVNMFHVYNAGGETSQLSHLVSLTRDLAIEGGSPASRPVFTIPYRRDDRFISRQVIFEDIDQGVKERSSCCVSWEEPGGLAAFPYHRVDIDIESENHRLQSSMPTASKKNTPEVLCSGYWPPHTRR